MKKPVITIENGKLNVDFSLSEDFDDMNMVEKYNNMQALIDMVFKDSEESCPNEAELTDVNAA